MNIPAHALLVAILGWLIWTTTAAFGIPAPESLRCEFLPNPLGIDHPHPRLSWKLSPEATDPNPERGLLQSAYRILVASSADRLAREEGDLWDSGTLHAAPAPSVEYAGTPVPAGTSVHWKVRITDTQGRVSPWSAPASWSQGFRGESEWQARWITAPPATNGPLPLFRKAFDIPKPVRRAHLAICGLGFHETRINGESLDDAVLEPGWTDYRKTCLYRVHDVTAHLKPGENVLGILLGNGMYHVPGGRYTKFTGSFGPPKVIARLDIEFADATTLRLVTDRSWKTAPGPIGFSCIFGGEDHDARRERAGWDRSGFTAEDWVDALECDGPGGHLTSRGAPPIRVIQTLTARSVRQPQPGLWVWDLGQNFSGWPKLTVQGPAGKTVKLIPGELLDAAGKVSQASSGSPVWFAYTLHGAPHPETWRPRFSYSGFRYVQVEGALPASEPSAGPDSPRILSIEGEFLGPDTPLAGVFECSNPEVNRVHDLILAAIRSNYKSVLTDCPHREKLGWLECSHLLAGCFFANYDCARFYEKIARDMADSQLPDGLVPSIAPEYVVFSGGFRDSPEWGSARILSPWRAYWTYGDRRILAEHYEGMKQYVRYLGGKARNHLVSHGLGDWYDIGPKGPGESQLTSRGLTATGVYYQDVETLHRIAELLGKTDDARVYEALAKEIAQAFNTAFLDHDQNRYDRNSQTANAMPLALGLVPPERRSAVLDNLVQDIQRRGNRVTAGDVGFYYVVQALLNGGRSDVLYDMLCQTNGPGYRYQLAMGATSLTEAWDTNPASSQNHCMLGHIEEWFSTGLLGIRAEEPGFRRILLRPQPVGDLTWARGHYDCPYGRIGSAWKREGDTFVWEVRIPANTTATLHVPALQPESIQESGQPTSQAPGLTFLRKEGSAGVFSAGSGSYRFQSKW